MLRPYTVSFFGHRIIEDFNRAEAKAEALIRDLILQKEYVEFLVGRNGDFDQIVSSAVKRLQRRIRTDNSSLVWVLPYPTAELRNHEESFQAYYDEIEICDAAENSYPKRAYQIRNRQMVDRSDLVVFYVEHNSGGAYQIQAERIRRCGMHKTKENGSSISPNDKMMNKKSSIPCGKCCFGESA